MEDCTDHLRKVIPQLPVYNRYLLQALMKCLAAVVAHADVNKMNASNVSIVFGPNILSKLNASIVDPDSSTVYYVCSSMIENYNKLFRVCPPCLRALRHYTQQILIIGYREGEIGRGREGKADAKIQSGEGTCRWRESTKGQSLAHEEHYGGGERNRSSGGRCYHVGRAVQKGSQYQELEEAMVRAEISKPCLRKQQKRKWAHAQAVSITHTTTFISQQENIIELWNCCVSVVPQKPFCFTITFETESLWLAASSEQELHDWMAAVNSCIDRKAERPPAEFVWVARTCVLTNNIPKDTFLIQALRCPQFLPIPRRGFEWLSMVAGVWFPAQWLACSLIAIELVVACQEQQTRRKRIKSPSR